jgi:galactose mutarotase-like enzyme
MNTKELVLLTLPGANSSVTLAPFRGGITTSLRLRGRELLYMDEATFLDPEKNVRGGIPVLFPTPGKLEGDRWRRHGREGVLKQHGFARNSAWSVASREPARVTLLLHSDASTLLQYPWPFEIRLRFDLAEHLLRIATHVRNPGTEPLPFALGFHPYFNVADKARARIRSGATRAFDNVTRTTAPFTGFDLTAAEVDLHLVDHPDDHLDLDLGDDHEIVVRAAPHFRRWVVWTLASKPFVCVEPWTAPGNALNTGSELTVLAPGEEQASWIEIELRAAESCSRP